MLSLMFAAGLAAGASATAGTCGCAETFAQIASAIETNYAGHVVKLPDEAMRATYRRFRDLMQKDARRALDPAACREVVDAYLAFFDDEHLFVKNASTSPGAASATQGAAEGAPATAANAPEIPKLAVRWTPEKVKFRLRREGALDAIEGLWRDREGDIAIVYDDAIPSGEYVAFRFSYRYGVRPDEIIAFIRPHGDGSYDIHYRTPNDAWQKTTGLLNNETGILGFGGIGWQRTTSPSSDADWQATVAPGDPDATAPNGMDAATDADSSNDPLNPRFRALGDGIVYLSVPSFMPRFRDPLEKLVETHREALALADGLILDLRGNSGGEPIHQPLADVLLRGPVVVREASAILASEWNIAHVEEMRAQQGEQRASLDAVLERMRASPGKIVPYLDRSVESRARGKQGPKHIAVLQDRAVGDAAEAFLLQLGQVANTVTIGEPTRGNIDYRQVNMHSAGCGAYQLQLGYPLYMRTRDLPGNALDASGIAPDVRLSPIHGDWVKYAERWLRAGRE